MKRSILAALLCGLCFAVPSLALEPVPSYSVAVGVEPSTVQLGAHVKISGHVRATGPGQRVSNVRVILYAQRFPYRHSFRAVASRRTSASGGYAFRPTFDRNTLVRVRISGSTTRSRTLGVDVVPRTHLSNRISRSGRRVRATVTARSPRDVRLFGAVDIYVGPFGATHLRKVSRPRLQAVRRGLTRASALITLPARYRGGYRIVSCYAAPVRTGMRERGFRCPRVADYGTASSASAGSYKP